MGNFQSSKQRDDILNFSISKYGETDEKTTRPVKQKQTKQCGIAGLRELGFEFRHVPCNMKHTLAGEDSICFECATRLFHLESDTMITAENRASKYIPDGPFFEEVAKRAQEVAIQEFLLPKFGLKLVKLEHSSESQELTALSDYINQNDSGGVDSEKRATFLFITGKGLSRAGIISAKQLIESGIEKGSAIYFLLHARQRQWNSIFLDPNAQGVGFGMDVVKKSLDILLGSRTGPLNILAHSAAGGYIVRYLIEKPNLNITSLVFTDSTHRIAWARKNPNLYTFLQSSRCLYIRNNSLGNPFAVENTDFHRLPGEPARSDVWWEQRFGRIPTVWGGTVDHSAVCWEARRVIWDFVDQIDRNES